MTRRPRRNHSPAFKTKLALAAIRGEQTLVELSQQFDVHANQIKQWKDQLLEGATGVFRDEAKAGPEGPTVDVKTLHAKIGKLTLEKDFLSGSLGKAGLLGGKNDRPQARAIRRAPGEASRLQPWQRLLSAPSGVRRRSGPMRRIDELLLVYPFAGSRMLQGLLRGDGLETGRLHVTTLMKKMGIEAIYRRANTSKPAPGHKIYPYLLRNLASPDPSRSGQWI